MVSPDLDPRGITGVEFDPVVGQTSLWFDSSNSPKQSVKWIWSLFAKINPC
jgi:hypothetical protein